MGASVITAGSILRAGSGIDRGPDAAALHCRSLGDSLSIAGRLKSVYGMRGHINPITTNLVVMVFY